MTAMLEEFPNALPLSADKRDYMPEGYSNCDKLFLTGTVVFISS